jgi:fatty-acyl-CoA synthase
MSASQPLANLADMVRDRAKTRGNALAYEFEGRQTSFSEFDIKTNRVANALKASGVSRASASPISARTATSISNC